MQENLGTEYLCRLQESQQQYHFNRYTIPLIDDNFNRMGHVKLFISDLDFKIDLASSYHLRTAF